MARTARQAARLAAAYSKIERLKAGRYRLEAAYRESLIKRVVDLEIIADIKKEKDRDQESLCMMDSKTYSLEALDYMGKTMVAILSRRNQPPESTRDQKEQLRKPPYVG